MTGPKQVSEPGTQVPDLPPAAPAAEAKQAQAAPLPGVLVKDLRKTPNAELAHRPAEEQAEARRKLKTDVPAEARTESEALELANRKGRAVMGPKGWVCPSTVQVRVPVVAP
jgi:hypothetical protein